MEYNSNIAENKYKSKSYFIFLHFCYFIKQKTRLRYSPIPLFLHLVLCSFHGFLLMLNLIRRVWQFACRPFCYQHFTGNPAKGTRKTNFPRYQCLSKSFFIRSFSFARCSKTSSQFLVLPLKPRGNFSQSLRSCFV